MSGERNLRWEVVLIFFKGLLLVFVLVAIWLIYEVTREGYSAWFIARFESEPKEGWDYWHAKRIRELLPSWLVAGGIALMIVSALLWTLFRSCKRLKAGR